MIVPHHNEELAAWITVNAETGEWVLVFGPVKHDVADPSGELCAGSAPSVIRIAAPPTDAHAPSGRATSEKTGPRGTPAGGV